MLHHLGYMYMMAYKILSGVDLPDFWQTSQTTFISCLGYRPLNTILGKEPV